MVVIRVPFRLLLLLLHVISGLSQMLFYVAVRHMDYADPIFQSHMRRWHTRLCRIFGVNITVHGQVSEQALLLVSNHISWLDISVYGAVFAPSFLSKAGVKNWPIIGWLATHAGTLYIKRGKKGEAEQAKQALVARMTDSHRVMFFPEGTTSDGKSVLRFHPRLFGSALEAEVALQPMAICYPHVDGVNPAVPYIDDMTLLVSVWNLVKTPQTAAVVHCLAEIKHNGESRETMARQASEVIKAEVESCHQN